MEQKLEKKSGGQFASQAVPADQRMKTTSLLGAMSGFIFMVTSFNAGATMGFSGDFATVLKAIGIGSVFLTIIAVVIGTLAAKTGMTFGQLIEYAYGKHGSKIIGFLIAFSLLGWTAVNGGVAASAIVSVFPSLPFVPISLISIVLFVSTVFAGMKAMTKIGTICIPILGILGVISAVMGINSVGGVSGLMAYAPAAGSELAFGSLVGIAIGSWIGCACSLLPDFMRFAKNTKVAGGLGILFMLILNPLILMIGAIGAISTGYGDFPYALAAQGLAIPGLLVGVLGSWGPTQGNVYSCSLTWGNIFKKDHMKMVIIAGVIALILAAINFFQYFGSFLIFLSNWVPAIIGVFMADYFYTYRNGYPAGEAIKYNWDWRGLVAVIVGIALTFIDLPGLTQLWSVGGAIVARTLLNLIGDDSPAKIYKN